MGIEELDGARSRCSRCQVVRRTDASAMADCAREIALAPRSSDVRDLARIYETLGMFADPDLGALMRHLLGVRVDRRSAPR
jgi:hypothetical protein